MAVRVSKSRVKRASPYDLYKTCATGVCPPDVVPKIEGDTLADRILKWGSLGVFFGSLGIGTGSGRAGATGYRPLGAGTSVRGGRLPSSTPSRPLGREVTTAPIDVIGPDLGRPSVAVATSDSITISSTIAPDAPSVITPDIMPVDHGVGGIEIATDNVSDPSIVFVETHGNNDVAVLDVRPTEHSPSTYQTSRSVHHNPSFQETFGINTDLGETSAVQNVFLGGSGIGSTGGEEIELQWLDLPRSSTPEGRFKPPRGRSNWFSKQYYTQVQVSDPAFAKNPEQYFAVSFENPVYEADSFELELRTPSAPVAAEVRDVTHVTAAQILQGPSGRVGIGRVGFRSTIQTRSGVTIGGRTHFRHSFSSILDTAENIELPTAVQSSARSLQHVSESVLTEGHDASVEVDLQSVGSVYSDADLLDELSESPYGVLSFSRSGETNTAPVRDVTFTLQRASIVPASDLSTTFVSHNASPHNAAVFIDDEVASPAIIIASAGVDGSYFINTFLHPSLLKRKKKTVHS